MNWEDVIAIPIVYRGMATFQHSSKTEPLFIINFLLTNSAVNGIFSAVNQTEKTMKLTENEALELIELVTNDLYSWFSYLIHTKHTLPDDEELEETFYPSETQRLRTLRFKFDYSLDADGLIKKICREHLEAIRGLRELTLI